MYSINVACSWIVSFKLAEREGRYLLSDPGTLGTTAPICTHTQIETVEPFCRAQTACIKGRGN